MNKINYVVIRSIKSVDIDVRNNREMLHMGIEIKDFAVYNIIHGAKATS